MCIRDSDNNREDSVGDNLEFFIEPGNEVTTFLEGIIKLEVNSCIIGIGVKSLGQRHSY